MRGHSVGGCPGVVGTGARLCARSYSMSTAPVESPAASLRSAALLVLGLQDEDRPLDRLLRPGPPLLRARADLGERGDDLIDRLFRLVQVPDDAVEVGRSEDLDGRRGRAA